MNKIKCKFRCLRRKIRATNTSTLFVISAVNAVTVYAVAAFLILAITGQNISDSLTVAWFSFWTVEIVSLASIKNVKTKEINKLKRAITPDDIRNAVNEYRNNNSEE